jgi:predicted secreted protein
MASLYPISGAAVSSVSIIGYGSDFQRSTDGSTYNTIGQLTDLVPPKMKNTTIDHSNLLSPEAWKEFRAGMHDGGSVTLKILFKKADYNTVYSDFAAGTAQYWKVLFADLVASASTLTFKGHVEELSTPNPMDDKVELDVTIKVTGKVTFTQGT